MSVVAHFCRVPRAYSTLDKEVPKEVVKYQTKEVTKTEFVHFPLSLQWILTCSRYKKEYVTTTEYKKEYVTAAPVVKYAPPSTVNGLALTLSQVPNRIQGV